MLRIRLRGIGKMANMSYCRFQNTVTDLADCEAHINDDMEDMSDEEIEARKELIEICKNIASQFEDDDEED
jgi:hypothetical protein